MASFLGRVLPLMVFQPCCAPLERVSDVTRILDRAREGDPKAAVELLPLVYAELRKRAAARMAGEASGHTLQPTALLHEASLRLVGNEAARLRLHENSIRLERGLC